MNVLEMLFLAALLGEIDTETDNAERKDELKEAVAKANEEYNTDIQCEIAKLKKERTEKKKQLDELTGEIATINVMINRLESLDKKINN